MISEFQIQNRYKKVDLHADKDDCPIESWAYKDKDSTKYPDNFDDTIEGPKFFLSTIQLHARSTMSLHMIRCHMSLQ